MTDPILKCLRCGGDHTIVACPYVKAVEFADEEGRVIRRLEFLTPADYGPARPVTQEPAAGDEYPRLPRKS